jgi:hypothetical protein
VINDVQSSANTLTRSHTNTQAHAQRIQKHTHTPHRTQVVVDGLNYLVYGTVEKQKQKEKHKREGGGNKVE